jgi:isopentenyl-diphosphate delta-isomerase
MNDSLEQIILVDEDDRQIGLADKLEAHRRGDRHRAISVCVTDDQGRMLLQKRALGKYHSGGLWTNACCTHPRPGETAAEAASRRLGEELGVVCPLQFLFVTHYRANVGKGLVEDEMVHLFNGHYNGAVQPDHSEVQDYGWFSPEFLVADISERPEKYTYWFRQYVFRHADAIFEREPLVSRP